MFWNWFCYWIFKTILWGRFYYYANLKDEKTEAKNGLSVVLGHRVMMPRVDSKNKTKFYYKEITTDNMWANSVLRLKYSGMYVW